MSNIDPQFRRLQQFDATGDGLKRAVSQLEQNVADALARIAQQAGPLPSPTNAKTTDYVAVLDDVVVVKASAKIRLPVAQASNQGRSVHIEVQAGTATVIPTTGLVQGTTSDALSTPGRYEYVSDGVGWWRAPSSSGGAGLALTDIIVNVGKGTGGEFTIAGSGLTAGKDVLIVQTAQPIPSKGNARDELEMDVIDLCGYVKDASTIQVYWHASGIVAGDYAFGYQVAA